MMGSRTESSVSKVMAVDSPAPSMSAMGRLASWASAPKPEPRGAADEQTLLGSAEGWKQAFAIACLRERHGRSGTCRATRLAPKPSTLQSSGRCTASTPGAQMLFIFTRAILTVFFIRVNTLRITRTVCGSSGESGDESRGNQWRRVGLRDVRGAPGSGDPAGRRTGDANDPVDRSLLPRTGGAWL